MCRRMQRFDCLPEYIGKICMLLYITEIVSYGFLTVVLLVQLAFAQECAQTIPFSVSNQRIALGSSELGAGLLQARTGHLQLRIEGVDKVPTRRVLVLVDRSGSMATRDEVWSHTSKAAKTAEEVAENFVMQIPPGVFVGYGVFQGRLFPADGFARDSNTLQDNIRNAKEKIVGRKNGTAIYDALAEGLFLFGETQPGDVILLITDGGDNQSKHSSREIENSLKQADVQLFLLLVSGHMAVPEEIEARDALITMARQTGGMVHLLDAGNPAWGFDKPTAAAAQEINNFLHLQLLFSYRLRVAVPPSSKNTQRWTLAVRADADARWRDVKLSYPDRLQPCALPITTR